MKRVISYSTVAPKDISIVSSINTMQNNLPTQLSASEEGDSPAIIKQEQIVSTILENHQDKQMCIQDQFGSLIEKLSQNGIYINIICNHNKLEKGHQKRLSWNLLFLILMCFIFCVWLTFVVFYPKEITLPYCGGFVYKEDINPFTYKMYLAILYTHIFALFLVMGINFSSNNCFIINDSFTWKIKILALIKNKKFLFLAKVTQLCTVMLFILIIGTSKYFSMEKDSGPFMSALCSLIFVYIMLHSASYFYFCIFAISLLEMIYRKFEECISKLFLIQGNRNICGELMKHLQEGYHTVCSELSQFNKMFGNMATILYSLAVSYIAMLSYIIIYADKLPIRFYLYYGIAMVLLSVLSTAAAMIFKPARECFPAIQVFDSPQLHLKERLRLLCFVKILGGIPVGIEVLDFVISKKFAFQMLKTITSRFMTLKQLHDLDKQHGCKHRVEANTTFS